MIWKTRDHTFDLTHRGLIMGVLNVTPDSFSDGGRFVDVGTAAERAAREQQTMPLDNLTTPKPDRLDSEAFGIHDGAYVSVERDCSPGKCSIGGTGFVQGEPASDGTYTVEYVEWIAFNGCQSHRNHGTKRSH